ncbi:MAG: GNAT family N-acetyltransferase, partial [Clostridia bacterium]|nr:GNAT family N-acetyltransferase [Clostridia bacterium]
SELYVIPSERSKGIGKELMRAAEKAASEQADVMVLSTATKNAKAILHFYLDEVGMEFYSARLFKRLS